MKMRKNLKFVEVVHAEVALFDVNLEQQHITRHAIVHVDWPVVKYNLIRLYFHTYALYCINGSYTNLL